MGCNGGCIVEGMYCQVRGWVIRWGMGWWGMSWWGGVLSGDGDGLSARGSSGFLPTFISSCSPSLAPFVPQPFLSVVGQ